MSWSYCYIFFLPQTKPFVQASRCVFSSPSRELLVAFPTQECDKGWLQEETCEMVTVVCKSRSCTTILVGESKMAPFNCCPGKKPDVLQRPRHRSFEDYIRVPNAHPGSYYMFHIKIVGAIVHSSDSNSAQQFLTIEHIKFKFHTKKLCFMMIVIKGFVSNYRISYEKKVFLILSVMTLCWLLANGNLTLWIWAIHTLKMKALCTYGKV